MKTEASIQENHWTSEEFLAYFLMYAAHADVQFQRPEKEHILNKVGPEIYSKIEEEFNRDHNNTQLQKILDYQLERRPFPPTVLIEEMRDLFLSDDKFHQLEQFVLSNMRRLFVQAYYPEPI